MSAFFDYTKFQEQTRETRAERSREDRFTKKETKKLIKRKADVKKLRMLEKYAD
jgi:hypothetical protein